MWQTSAARRLEIVQVPTHELHRLLPSKFYLLCIGVMIPSCVADTSGVPLPRDPFPFSEIRPGGREDTKVFKYAARRSSFEYDAFDVRDFSFARRVRKNIYSGVIDDIYLVWESVYRP